MRIAVTLVMVIGSLAAAGAARAGGSAGFDLQHELDGVFGGFARDDSGPAPAFAMVGSAVFDGAKTAADTVNGHGDKGSYRTVVAFSADKKVGWLAADLAYWEVGCGAAPCPPPPPPPPAEIHATALYEKAGAGWRPVVWDIADVVSGKDQAAAIKKGVMPGAIARKIDGADEAVKVFEATIGDPAALARSVSDRKDVVLYGSEAAERVIGGAQAAAMLKAWGLSFKVRDGIRAGVSSSKQVAWIAANLDASSVKKPKDAPVPYRALFLYEKKGGDWKLVQLNFAYVASQD
jgi:hypothetical protein